MHGQVPQQAQQNIRLGPSPPRRTPRCHWKRTSYPKGWPQTQIQNHDWAIWLGKGRHSQDLVIRTRELWSQHFDGQDFGRSIYERNQRLLWISMAMGNQGRSYLRRKHERNQNQRCRLCLTCRRHPQRRRSNYPNRKKTLLCLRTHSSTKIVRAYLYCWNHSPYGRNGRSVQLPQHQKRNRYWRRISLRNSFECRESLLTSRWIIRIYCPFKRINPRTSLPSMCVWSLAKHQRWSLRTHKQDCWNHYPNQKEKATESWNSSFGRVSW